MDNDDVISTLNDLIETCKDGEYGYRASAEHLRNAQTRMRFVQAADQCGVAAARLAAEVMRLGGKAEDGGSLAGAMHRGWVSVRSTLSTQTDLAILEEAENGEDKALESYRDALEQPLPEPVRSLVQTQYEDAKRNHDEVRRMRNDARAVDA
jgi:uncharacterized protein (TIGR02284 family)